MNYSVFTPIIVIFIVFFKKVYIIYWLDSVMLSKCPSFIFLVDCNFSKFTCSFNPLILFCKAV